MHAEHFVGVWQYIQFLGHALHIDCMYAVDIDILPFILLLLLL